MQFESHLGHSNPLVRGVFALTCVRRPEWVPLTLVAAGAWRRGGLFGYVGGWVRVLACGPSACWNLGYVPSYLAVPVASCWPSLIHGQ